MEKIAVQWLFELSHDILVSDAAQQIWRMAETNIDDTFWTVENRLDSWNKKAQEITAFRGQIHALKHSMK